MDLEHPHRAHTAFDGGDLDCGNGLLLQIRKHIDPLERGQLLELRSTEISVDEELPAWCRLTGNELVSFLKQGRQRSFLISKGPFQAGSVPASKGAAPAPGPRPSVSAEPQSPAASAPVLGPREAPPIPPFAVLGVGSWPRPRWLMEALHQRLEGRLAEAEFESAADDAVRLCAAAQQRAGADVLSDGEQRRDGYASFVGAKLENCQLIPITDLLPYVEDPEEFARELRALDVPAEKVRHPAVFGRIGRAQPLAVHEARFLASIHRGPIKVALPGPYLLTRTLWLECVSERAYRTRDALAADVIQILRAELAELLAAGVAVVQFDEPVLSEVVFGKPTRQRSFMCGALGERGEPAAELDFAAELLAAVTSGSPAERLGLHVCRGNWTPDESAALSGPYDPLMGYLARAPVGTLFLEACTPRAGDLEVLRRLPASKRLALGFVNPKDPAVETVHAIHARAQAAALQLGSERLWLTADCGFATFADNPVASQAAAEGKLQALAQAAARLRGA